MIIIYYILLKNIHATYVAGYYLLWIQKKTFIQLQMGQTVGGALIYFLSHPKIWDILFFTWKIRRWKRNTMLNTTICDMSLKTSIRNFIFKYHLKYFAQDLMKLKWEKIWSTIAVLEYAEGKINDSPLGELTTSLQPFSASPTLSDRVSQSFPRFSHK